MRLFIACEISTEAKKVLSGLQSSLKFAKFTKVSSDAMHLTLKFLGEVSEKKLDEIKQRLSAVSFKPFMLKLDSIGFFPNEHNPRVVWIGIKPAGPVIRLQQKTEKSLLGLFQKDKKFHPHITICRVKFVENRKGLKELLKNLKVEPVEFEINSIKLFKSELLPEGPRYELLKEFLF